MRGEREREERDMREGEEREGEKRGREDDRRGERETGKTIGEERERQGRERQGRERQGREWTPIAAAGHQCLEHHALVTQVARRQRLARKNQHRHLQRPARKTGGRS